MAIFSKSGKAPSTNLPSYQNQEIESAYDRIIFEQVATAEDVFLVELARELKNGRPLVLNFEVLGPDESNKTVAFLSGCIYILDGIIEKISDKIFLFARRQELRDGTLQKFIDEYKEL